MPCLGLQPAPCLPNTACHLSAAVRYLELLKGPGGQAPITPLADIIALLGAAGGKAAREAGADGHSSSGGSGSGSGRLDPAEKQGQHKEMQQAAAAAAVPCTVIYCHRREDADRVAAGLRTRGIACAAYHAGLPDAARSRVLADWQARRLSVVAATVAFGMGIDRAGGWLCLVLAGGWAMRWAALPFPFTSPGPS